MSRLILAIFLASLALASAAIAADPAGVKATSSGAHGPYLTDAQGRALYLFTADTKGQGGNAPVIACADECRAAWPLFQSDGAPQAVEGVDAALLGTIAHDGKTVVTYNGWPLYYFAKDQGPGSTAGQDVESFDGEWYLVTPAGERAGQE
jgi:predicted lipoprotein with Yx(FWY)xxD motif